VPQAKRVQTLQLLYQQAAGVHPLMKSKVVEWLRQTGNRGLLPGFDNTLVRLEEMGNGAEEARGGQASAGSMASIGECSAQGACERIQGAGYRVRSANGSSLDEIVSSTPRRLERMEQPMLMCQAEEELEEGYADGEGGVDWIFSGTLDDVQWPPLKRLDRAAEKLMRSYAADVSRCAQAGVWCGANQKSDCFSDVLDWLLADLMMVAARTGCWIHVARRWSLTMPMSWQASWR
jgi:hypothetical protein